MRQATRSRARPSARRYRDRLRDRREREAAPSTSRSCIISRTWRCMDFFIWWVMITRQTADAQEWRGWKRVILARLDVPDPYIGRQRR